MTRLRPAGWLWGLLWGLLWLPAQPAAAEGRPTEYEVKAAFLHNFARFVTWPEGTAQDTLRLCIVGEDPFGAAFSTVLGRAAPQPIQVHRHAAVAAEDCQVLFVSRSEAPGVAALLASVAARPVLTVSDIDDFAASGGIIGFVIRQNKVRFQINPAAAERAGVVLSAKLLRLAEIVADKGPR